MASSTEQKVVEVIIKGQAANASLREIQSASRVLNAELKKLPVTSQEFKDKAEQLKSVNTRLKSINDDLKNVKGGIADASKETMGWQDVLKGVFGAGLIEKGIDLIKDFGVESVKSFMEAEANAHRLKFALDNISKEGSGALDKLLKQSAALQEQGIFSDDDIQKSQAALIQYGLTSDQVEKLVPQILDLAAAQGIDLSQATDKVINGIGGQTKGLKDVGIQFKDTGSKTENLAILTDKLTKFLGANTAELESNEGTMKRYANRWDDIKESVGEFLVGVAEGIGVLSDIATKGLDATNLDIYLKRLKKTTIAGNDLLLEAAARSEKDKLAIIFQSDKQIIFFAEQVKNAKNQKAFEEAKYRLENEENLNKKLRQVEAVRSKVLDDATMAGLQKDEEANKKILEAKKKLYAQLDALQQEADDRGLGKDMLELTHIDEKYARLQEEAKGNAEALARIDWLYAQEYADALEKQEADNNAIRKKANDKLLAEKEKWDNEIYLATLSSNDRERVVIMQKYEKLVEAAGLNKDAIVALKKQEEQELNDLNTKQAQKEIADAKKLHDLKIRAIKDFQNQVMSIADSYATIQANKDIEELRQNDDNLHTKLVQNDSNLKADRVSQAKHDKIELEAQKKHDKLEAEIKQKAFERDQEIAIFKTLIAGAEGIAQIWATYAAAPYVAAALTVAEVAVIGAQIAAIEGAPKPYAAGGYNKKSNDPQGYTSDSTLYTGSASGQPFIAGEAGKEWIAPNWMMENPQTAPIIEHLENIRQSRSFAIGGSNTVKSASASNNMQQSNNNQSAELCAAVNRLTSILDSGIEARLSYDLYTSDLAKINNSKLAARVG